MERTGLGNLQLVTDEISVADWIVTGVRDFDQHVVGSLLPAGFDAYARLFHPAYLGASLGEVSWASIAAANQRRAHAGMQWAGISGCWPFRQDGHPGIWDEQPATGSLPAAQAEHLVAVLERFTTTRECFYAVWEGFGALAVPLEGIASVAMPARRMILLRGSMDEAATASMETAPFEQSPSLWWPADRAWCVATDVDLMSTYIGASTSCLAAIVNESRLETWPVSLDHSLTMDSDELNAVPPYRSGRG